MSTASLSSVSAPSVLYEARDRVARITLNRPEVSNAIDVELAHRLREAVRRAGTDASIDAVLLAGAGRTFCAGGDVTAMGGAVRDRSACLASLAEAAHEAVRAMNALPKPLVAAVQGAAAGAGFAFALGADMVVAGRSTKFVTAYTSLGLTPDSGLSWLLPRAIGQQRALELIMTSTPLGSEQAQVLGIVSQVCDDDDVIGAAHRLAGRLASRPTGALGEARRLVRTSWANSLDEHLDREAETISRISAGDEAAVLMARFLGRSTARSEEGAR